MCASRSRVEYEHCFNIACSVRGIKFNLSSQQHTHYNVNTIVRQEKLVSQNELFIFVENSPEKQNKEGITNNSLW
jgi:hypothetical protein